MNLRRVVLLSVACLLLSRAGWGADDVLTLSNFEEPVLPNTWEFNAGEPRLVRDGALEGKQSLEISFDPSKNRGAYFTSFRLPRDWSAYDALVVDVLNPGEAPVEGSLLVADQAWADSGRSYWNRHNGGRAFPPGRTQWIIPVRGLYRGEAGSRNNDIPRDIDPASIVRVDFGFGAKGQAGRIVVDDFRLVKVASPEDVWAFDFGPPSQSVMLGWTAVSNETGYTAEQGYGWGPQGGKPWDGAARDTTFGTALLQDFCEAGGYNFRVDVPPGKYRVTVFYENSGYWGGEQAQQRQRRILAGGESVWEETRPDGAAHALYRFEDVEPVGVDIWKTYMEPELARPAVFEATAGNDGLVLRFESDKGFGSRLAGLAIRGENDAEAERWLDEQMKKLAGEFRSKAVCLDPAAPAFEVAPEWRERGLAAWPVQIEDEIMPYSVPPKAGAMAELKALAVRGEYEPFCIALRPLQDLGECQLELEPFRGPGPLQAEASVVRYNTSRDFGSIAYHVRPHTLRRATRIDLPKDVAREVIVTALIPPSAPPGRYEAVLHVKQSDGKILLSVPLRLTVSSATLERKTDYLMGYFGLMPPRLVPDDRREAVLEETLRMLRAHGMNALSGGPDWRLTGWQSGKPLIDFEETDRFFALLRKHGFDRPINGYGGLRFEGLHQGYQKGEVAKRVEQESGLRYEQALETAWEAVDSHARQAGWPTIYYAMCDETRVRETAERELAFMRLMAPVSARFPQTVRASGSYSVSFQKRVADPDDMLYWHQQFFAALDISSLNSHDPTVMAEARQLGKDVHIYNQGRSRYSFGLYQWSEFQKGVVARWQWHLNVLHGYQFFDLDGREPDTAMICYGRQGVYPTIHFERCREGAEDFYLFQTLARLVAERRRGGNDDQEHAAATALVERLAAAVPLNQRTPPPDFDPDRTKAEVVKAIEDLLEP